MNNEYWASTEPCIHQNYDCSQYHKMFTAQALPFLPFQSIDALNLSTIAGYTHITHLQGSIATVHMQYFYRWIWFDKSFQPKNLSWYSSKIFDTSTQSMHFS